VTVSMATMIAYSSRMAVERVDPVAIGQYWSERGEDLFRSCVTDRDLLPADQSIDVLFHDFMDHDLDTVARIYALAEQPLPESSLAAMNAFSIDHPRGRHGTIAYQGDVLGISRTERSQALAFYVDRFGIQPETVAP
jgi:hypothetical protein